MIGFLLGPMAPIAANHTARVLPRHLVNGTVGWMAACGAGGSALLPFLTGAMASNLGVESLEPLCVFQPTPSSSQAQLPDKKKKTFSDDFYVGSCLGLCA